MKIFKIEDKYIDLICNKSKIVVARYTTYTGLHTHIDKLRRSNGPIITMSLGSEMNIYDLVPLNSCMKSMRVYFPKGSIVSMTGNIRYDWAHGLPFGYKYSNRKPRYSIIFLMDAFEEIKKTYSNVLKDYITFTLRDCTYYMTN